APGQYNPGSQKGQELIGHELTHVVQQREGRVAPTKQGKGLPVNDNPALEKEADEMGAKAAQGKMADVAGNGSGVQRKEVNEETGSISNVNKESSNVGEYTWQQTDSIIGWWHDYQITVKNRSVEEWKNFLINEAATREGGIELNLYIGTALYGKNAFYNSLTADHATKIKLTDYVKDSGIVQPENLMVALLTVGDKMDLQDSPYEGGGSRISKDSLLKLVNGFTAKYSAQALQSMSYLDYESDNIKAFLEVSVGDGFNSGAAYFGDEFSYGDVHVKLINGALAAAFGHMNELACLAAKYPDEKGVEKNAIRTQVKNMGKTVQTAIKTIKNLKTRQASINLAVFESILEIGTAGVDALISGAVKSMLFAGAAELAKIGLKSLVGVSDEGKRIEAYEKDFEMAFEKVLKEVYSNSELENSQKGDIDTELGFAKLHFLSGLDD
ncbi:MAG: DUF4157 domain-containing protein, partial [Bacteroidales bacterium]|nr:DUF4157 domain-containing protein [Bacteroidales bacterium]